MGTTTDGNRKSRALPSGARRSLPAEAKSWMLAGRFIAPAHSHLEPGSAHTTPTAPRPICAPSRDHRVTTATLNCSTTSSRTCAQQGNMCTQVLSALSPMKATTRIGQQPYLRCELVHSHSLAGRDLVAKGHPMTYKIWPLTCRQDRQTSTGTLVCITGLYAAKYRSRP